VPGDRLDHWLLALEARHRSELTSAEFLKAVRALSARYVERRADLPGRSALDSAGKRAAFAAFYAPLHFLTTSAVVRSLGAETRPLQSLLDLGCGTGVASAACAIAFERRPSIQGVDRNSWAIQESRWNWQQLGVTGRARRGDLVVALEDLVQQDRPSRTLGIVAAWSVNELPSLARARVLRALLAAARLGAFILILEPLSRAATPWWDEWASAFTAAGGRSDQWKFEIALPSALAAIDRAAGFRREALGAKTLSII
jgi:hypothetical protein